MSNKFCTVISALMAALLTASSVFTTSILATGAPSGYAETEKITLNFRSEALTSKNTRLYRHTPTKSEPDPMLGGKYSFDYEKQALRIEYSPNSAQAPYRVMLGVTDSALVTDGYSHMVVVYRAKTDMPYRLSVWNSLHQGVEAIVTENGTDTADKWIVSDPIDITAVKNKNSLLMRFLSLNTVSISTSDTEAEFYMKEISFFKSAEDAKNYYATADLDAKASVSTVSPSQSAPQSQNSGATASHYGVGFITVPDDQVPASEKLPSPVIMDFSSRSALAKNAMIALLEGPLEGEYEFVKLPDGTSCMRLKYSPGQGHQAYRIMPTFTSRVLTAEHKYCRVTFMTTDKNPPKITVANNATASTVILSQGVAYSSGEFVRTNAVRIDNGGVLDRLMNMVHCNFEYHSQDPNSVFYIKEIAFFASADQAYEYYGDEAAETYVAMTFDDAGNGAVNREGSDFGVSVYNKDAEALEITYAPVTNRTVNYMAKIKFNQAIPNLVSNTYVRVLYAAEHPEGIETASMFIRNDRLGEECVRVVADVKNTDGEFVLSETVRLTKDITERFAGRIHNSFMVNPTKSGGKYSIKAIYFFPTRKMADSFTAGESLHTMTINGNDVSKYKIVVSDEATANIKTYAFLIAERIRKLTGFNIEITNDSTPMSEYEILVGPSSRELSTKLTDRLNNEIDGYKKYCISLDGNTLVISAVLAPAVEYAADRFIKDSLYGDVAAVPEVVVIDERDCFTATETTIGVYPYFDKGGAVDAPYVLNVDFDTDEGYFNEENGENNWKYLDGVYTAVSTDSALSYIHVYEKNAVFGVKMKYTEASDGRMGIMLRYNSADAYVKAGYDFAEKAWFIDCRDGMDFYKKRLASVPADLTADLWYELCLTVYGETATLSVNGETVITVYNVDHFSPGRAAVFTDRTAVSIDDASLTLTSGQGTVIKNVHHTKLPDEVYREGGSVVEMTDGSLTYLHHSNTTFRSLDNGASWQRADTWTSSYGYVNKFRMNNGELISVASRTVNGKAVITAITSSDDGKTWTEKGAICEEYYKGTTAKAGNMNDKFTQSADGRLFYVQAYESSTSIDGRRVFCRFFYSDDNGSTWTASKTDSWEIPDNEKEAYFGECKILACADGTLRVYSSWNMYGYIVYSESRDNGATWGPIQIMPEFPCPVSSMQFVRDRYAENDTTYYMVWVNSVPVTKDTHNPRSRLSLAKSADGKTWEFIGDIWRWESSYIFSSLLNIIVDPFINVTEDYIICGSGFSDGMPLYGEGDAAGHMGQRQHIYSIRKDTLPEGKMVNSFTDVPHGAPYYSAVSYVNAKGLFKGTSETDFSPDVIMNRAMFVTVLGRLDGVDTSAYTGISFNDVDAVNGSWYAPYVEWAAANGIVNGMGDGSYGVNNSITIEQACLILARYADYAADGAANCMEAFDDAASVSTWAKDGVEWAVSNRVYEGQNDRLNPTAPASRAAVAQMFYNYSVIFCDR